MFGREHICWHLRQTIEIYSMYLTGCKKYDVLSSTYIFLQEFVFKFHIPNGSRKSAKIVTYILKAPIDAPSILI